MLPEPSFDDLMTRLGAGDQDAATQLFQRFAGRLIALARSRLDPLLRQKLDPKDVLQSVFKSFSCVTPRASGTWTAGTASGPC